MDKEDTIIIKRAYGDKLKDKRYGLLSDREKRGEWEKFLGTIEIELIGLEDELASINYYKLRAKISSLRYLRFSYFRKTIFECMNLVTSIYDTIDD